MTHVYRVNVRHYQGNQPTRYWFLMSGVVLLLFNSAGGWLGGSGVSSIAPPRGRLTARKMTTWTVAQKTNR